MAEITPLLQILKEEKQETIIRLLYTECCSPTEKFNIKTEKLNLILNNSKKNISPFNSQNISITDNIAKAIYDECQK